MKNLTQEVERNRKDLKCLQQRDAELDILFERTEVCQSEKADGVHVQKLTICYNCIGSFEIPEHISLPLPDVSMQTRKGVLVEYGGVQTAIYSN